MGNDLSHYPVHVRGSVLLVALLVCALFSPGSSPPARSQTAPPQMNFLVIVTDDQRAEAMAGMRNTKAWFAGRGTTYRNAFATTPLCCPSRSSLFTGRYAHNHGVRTNAQAHRLDQDTTVQHYLHESGYRTGIFGKYLNGWRADPPDFDRWAITSDHAYRLTLWNIQGRERIIRQYGTSFIEDQTMQFLREAERDDSQPWLLFVAPQAPHFPYTPERDSEKADVPRWDPGPAINARSGRDKPLFMQNLKRLSPKRMRAIRSDQLRTLISVDELVRDVGIRLHRLGELEQTVAFFLSDNGFTWGDHRLLGTSISKATPYTPSIRVPMYMSIGAGERSRDNRLVAPLDIAPTIMQLAPFAERTGPEMDGRSLLDEWERRWLLIERWHTNDAKKVPEWHSLRGRRAQYVRYVEYGEVNFREYYDLARDPGQLENLLGDRSTENDPNVAELDSILDGYVDCAGANCP